MVRGVGHAAAGSREWAHISRPVKRRRSETHLARRRHDYEQQHNHLHDQRDDERDESDDGDDYGVYITIRIIHRVSGCDNEASAGPGQ